MNKISNSIKSNKVYYIVASIILVAIFLVLLLTIKKHSEQALVKTGTVENSEITTGFVIKKEAVIDKDSSKVMVPVISEGEKVSKNSIIATYKGVEYNDYEETLARLDKEILEQMKELPTVYSSEVDAIDEIIYGLIKESVGEKSYNKMQEYKQKINSNINKRATIIGNLSPDGAEIKKLIAKRNEYEESAKKSNDNILAPITGIVSYKTDGLENNLNVDNIDKLTYNDIKAEVKNKLKTNNNQIKVVNNYEAYLVINSSLNYLEYMEEQTVYRIRLLEANNYELRATLVKIQENENGVEVFFKITNGIENLVDTRETQIEIIWDWDNGLYVPISTIEQDATSNINYVTAIKYAENIKIPVKLGTKNDSFVIISNYTLEELEQLNIESDYKVTLHDRIIINKEK